MSTPTPNLTDKVLDLLSHSVGEVFKTMLTLEVQPAPTHDLHASDETLVAGSVGFIGDATGVVYIQVTASFARTLAGRMLGLAEAELDGDAMVCDVIGELSNMIVGSVKSRLCDSGAACVLTIPSVVRGKNFKVEPASGSQHRLLGFRCGADHILVELLMKYSK
ncbi:MAG: chemotaxis protein CheX [Verrucomicrobiota bacterium]